MENRFFFILRNLSVFLFLCPAITLYAQDIVDLKEQYDKAIALYNGNDYHAAAAVLEEILPEVEKVYEDTASYYNLLNTLGDTYLQLSQPMKAKTCFYRVWKAYLANPRPQHTEYSLFAAVSLGNIYQSTRHTDSVFYFYQQAVKTWDDLQGEWDDTYLDLYSNMLVASEKIHPVKDVDSLYIRYLKRIAKVKSKNDVLYAQTQVSLADRYVQQESFEQAQPLYTEGLKVLKDSGMVQEFLYLEGNYNLGRIWMKKNKYPQAESVFMETWKGTEGIQQHIRLRAYSALQLAYIARHYRRYDEALTYLSGLLQQYPEADTEFKLNVYSTLASIYLDKGDWILAEEYYNQALSMRTVQSSPKVRLKLLAGLINLYESEGHTEKSAPLLVEAKELALSTFGDKSEEYAHLLALNAAQQKLLGQWTQAEENYKAAIGILEIKAKDRTEEWIFLYNNLADVYQLLGRENDAETYYNKAATTAASTWGNNSVDYAYTLTNLAGILEKKGKYDNALANYNKALLIFEKNLGKNNIDYLSVMNNIAYVYVRKAVLTEADTKLTSLLPQAEKTLGKEHVLVTTMLNNLGLVREKQERYKEASDYYAQSLQRRRKAHGARHPLVTDVYCNLARSMAAQKNYAGADTCWFQALENFKAEINLYFPVMSEKEKSAFYYTIQDRFEQFNSYAVNHVNRSDKMLEYMFRYQTLTKSLLFRSNRKMHELLQKNSDAKVQKTWFDWERQREQLATLYSTGKLTPEKQDSLERSIELLERELSKSVTASQALFKLDVYNWTDIQNKLAEGDAWVEVVRFRKYKPEKGGTYVKYKFQDDQIERDSVYYAFIIIDKSNEKPQLVLIKNGTELEIRYIKYYYNTVVFKLPDEHTFQQFWKPVHEKLAHHKKLYVSSDGVYHLLNISTIKDRDEKYMLDHYDIYAYTGASDMLEFTTHGKSKHVRLVGSPEFAEVKIGSTTTTPAPLPGTLEEVQSISSLFKQKGWKVTLSSGFNASERALKETEGPYVLHVATHGYFLEDIEASKDNAAQAENPLMRSGLILAKNNDKADMFSDGILSAYEAMSLPLAGTRLVVLSACQTGQGKLKNGEGVYGLQRALRSSGASSIVLSLWKVDDVVTRELMVNFYEIWLGDPNLEMKQAFFKAQRMVKEKYPEPYFWGAFTWVGN